MVSFLFMCFFAMADFFSGIFVLLARCLLTVVDLVLCSVRITRTPGRACPPPNRLTAPPKGVEFEHLGGAQINPVTVTSMTNGSVRIMMTQ